MLSPRFVHMHCGVSPPPMQAQSLPTHSLTATRLSYVQVSLQVLFSSIAVLNCVCVLTNTVTICIPKTGYRVE